MTNRLKDRFEEKEPEETPEGDFWEVSGESGFFYVSEDTARRILGELGRRPPPRWLRFTDLFGSEVRVLSRHVHLVEESTEAQRARARRFRRARRDEERADRRPWEDDW